MNICGKKILIPKIYTGSVVIGCKTITEEELRAVIIVQQLANKGIDIKFDEYGLIRLNPDSGDSDHITVDKIKQLLNEMKNAYKNCSGTSGFSPSAPKRQ